MHLKSLCIAVLWAFCLTFFVAFGAGAQEADAGARAEAEAKDNEIYVQPVIVNEDELFRVRGSSTLPATERAKEVALRIEEIALQSESTHAGHFCRSC